MSIKYQVVFDGFTQRHYIKKIIKRYSEKVWKITEVAIIAMCQNADTALQSEKLETISNQSGLILCKLDFRIAGTGKSAQGSGNRSIVLVDTNKSLVTILLVYHKNDLTGVGNETVKWKRIIKDNFPLYINLV